MLNHPSQIQIEDFSYTLPNEKIAYFPLEDRDGSKLLIYRNSIHEDSYSNIDKYLNTGSLIIFNNTRVVQARLNFMTALNKKIEIFCLEPAESEQEIAAAMQKKSNIVYKCLVGGLKHWKNQETLSYCYEDCEKAIISARMVEECNGSFHIELSWSPEDLTFAEILEKTGKIPLPPYIKRSAEQSDKERYQTVYAAHDGSVAAPTAGLHFTPSVINRIKEKDIRVDHITLHVGAGTFKPVKGQTMAEHDMHAEQVVVGKDFIRNLRDSLSNDIIAVGTTSLRTIESLYWFGLKIHKNLFEHDDVVKVNQWDPYEQTDDLTPAQALEAIIQFLEHKDSDTFIGKTELMIAPGYKWKFANVLATNFHQPKSTLILLVAAFVGDNWRHIYEHALTNNYRFLSYGDGSLLYRQKT